MVENFKNWYDSKIDTIREITKNDKTAIRINLHIRIRGNITDFGEL